MNLSTVPLLPSFMQVTIQHCGSGNGRAELLPKYLRLFHNGLIFSLISAILISNIKLAERNVYCVY